jgi:hypothetical protein
VRTMPSQAAKQRKQKSEYASWAQRLENQTE